jgi:hypothetical protein
MITVKFLRRLWYLLNPAYAISIKAIYFVPPLRGHINQFLDYLCRLTIHVNIIIF